jgi:hypothetical protein
VDWPAHGAGFGSSYQRIIRRNKRLAVNVTDIVQEQIHERQPTGACYNFVTGKRVVFQKLFLRFIQFQVLRYPIISSQEETTSTAGGSEMVY